MSDIKIRCQANQACIEVIARLTAADAMEQYCQSAAARRLRDRARWFSDIHLESERLRRELGRTG